MPILIGIVGKPSSGKSSFFKAATMIDVKIDPRPFTTIHANRGVAQVTAPCIGKEFGVACKPKNYACDGETHFIPIELLDVAGLVPGSHAGKGRGNLFLNDLVRGEALIHVVDASGTTDAEGNPTEGHDPFDDIRFLEEEIDLWFKEVIKRNLPKMADKRAASQALGGLGIKAVQVDKAMETVGLAPDLLAQELRRLSKPIVIAANKIDMPTAQQNFERIKGTNVPNIFPCSAQAEIALRQASKSGLIEYTPGAPDFVIKDAPRLSDEQTKALEYVRANVLKKYHSTGVQQTLNAAVFEMLGYFPVYPVENETRLTDKAGNALPDVRLLLKDSTALDLATKVHAELAKGFIRAIDCRTKKALGKEAALKAGDVIKIVARA